MPNFRDRVNNIESQMTSVISMLEQQSEINNELIKALRRQRLFTLTCLIVTIGVLVSRFLEVL